LWSDVEITDTSDNISNNVREYKILVNDTYSIFDEVELKSKTDFTQTVKMTELSSPAIVNWVTINAHYEANVWEQTIDWNGLNKTTYTHSNVPENN